MKKRSVLIVGRISGSAAIEVAAPQPRLNRFENTNMKASASGTRNTGRAEENRCRRIGKVICTQMHDAAVGLVRCAKTTGACVGNLDVAAAAKQKLIRQH